MSGGRFFNTLGYDPGNPNPQSNNFNNNGNSQGMMTNNSMQSASQIPGNPMNPVGMMNSMNQGNMAQNSNQMVQGNPMNQSNSMIQGNPMVNANPMNNGSPMQQMNPMNQGNSMNNGNPINQGMFMNKAMSANQYFGPIYQDLVPPMGVQGNSMNNSVTGANQGFIGVQQVSMNMNQPNQMNSMGNPNAMMQNNVGVQGTSMNQVNNNFMGAQQETIMMSSNNTSGFNKSLNVNAMGNPIAQPMPQIKPSNLSMRSKLKLDVKKIFIIGALSLVVIIVLLCLICSKTVTCTREDKIQGAVAETSIKVSYWFNKISKIETKVTWDMSGLDSKSKEILIKTYEELDDGSHVQITDKKIVVTKIHKPTKEDKKNGEDKIKPDDLIEDYESSGLVCK